MIMTTSHGECGADPVADIVEAVAPKHLRSSSIDRGSFSPFEGG